MEAALQVEISYTDQHDQRLTRTFGTYKEYRTWMLQHQDEIYDVMYKSNGRHR